MAQRDPPCGRVVSRTRLGPPGSSFNVPYRSHFRMTFLPHRDVLGQVFERLDDLLDGYEP